MDTLISVAFFIACMVLVIFFDLRNAKVTSFKQFNWQRYWNTNQVRLIGISVAMAVAITVLYLFKQWIDGIVQQLIAAIVGLVTTVASKEVSKDKTVKPKMTFVEQARQEMWVREEKGAGKHNKRILQYASDQGLKTTTDEEHWCAIFAGWVLWVLGYTSLKTKRAKDYLTWGVPATWDDVKSGNVIAILHRGDPNAPTGHVCFPTSTPVNGYFMAVGGNQSDGVTETKFKEADLAGLRKAA